MASRFFGAEIFSDYFVCSFGLWLETVATIIEKNLKTSKLILKALFSLEIL